MTDALIMQRSITTLLTISKLISVPKIEHLGSPFYLGGLGQYEVFLLVQLTHVGLNGQ